MLFTSLLGVEENFARVLLTKCTGSILLERVRDREASETGGNALNLS